MVTLILREFTAILYDLYKFDLIYFLVENEGNESSEKKRIIQIGCSRRFASNLSSSTLPLYRAIRG